MYMYTESYLYISQLFLVFLVRAVVLYPVILSDFQMFLLKINVCYVVLHITPGLGFGLWFIIL